jgi:hypothetical protein
MAERTDILRCGMPTSTLSSDTSACLSAGIKSPSVVARRSEILLKLLHKDSIG